MSTFLVVDKILSLPVVRWALVALTACLLIVTLYKYLQAGKLSLELAKSKSLLAAYENAIDMQNIAVKKLEQETKENELRLQEAVAKVSGLQLALNKRKVEVREIELTGTCDEMVKQTFKELTK